MICGRLDTLLLCLHGSETTAQGTPKRGQVEFMTLETGAHLAPAGLRQAIGRKIAHGVKLDAGPPDALGFRQRPAERKLERFKSDTNFHDRLLRESKRDIGQRRKTQIQPMDRSAFSCVHRWPS